MAAKTHQASGKIYVPSMQNMQIAQEGTKRTTSHLLTSETFVQKSHDLTQVK